MRQPVVDYRKLRLSNICTPQYRHLLYLLDWAGYFILYFLTENLIPESACHLIHCHLDDLIPFNEYFLIFYCTWYLLIIFSLGYFLLYDVQSFVDLQKFIIITQIVAMVIYIIYPSAQNGRPQVFEHQNFFTWLMGIIYAFDTPTGVCPSLHVAYSIGIASAWLKYKGSSKGWKIFMVLLVIMISISVCFVKQHSAIDVIAALPLGALAEYLVYRGRYYGKKRKQATVEK